MQLFPKIISGMSKSVNPDQRSDCSGSALFAYAILSDTLVYKTAGH